MAKRFLSIIKFFKEKKMNREKRHGQTKPRASAALL
jgi:hypothetical protein